MVKTGDTLHGRYALRSLLGGGGLGKVFLALDLRTEREVTVKVFSATQSPPQARLRYQGLVAAALGVSHPAVVLPRVQVDLLGEPPLIVSEVLEGADLGELLRGGRLAWPRAVEIALACAEALATLEDATDTAHRALKPGNVWICLNGQVRVLDFGVAELGVHPVHTRDDGAAVEYRAAEQIEGQPGDPRSDVFTIGVLLFELITGLHPFAAASPAEAAANVVSALPWSASRAMPSAAIPATLDALITRMLARDPDDRFADTQELGRQLALIRRTAESVVRSPVPRPRLRPQSDEHSTSLFLPIVRRPRLATPDAPDPPQAPPAPATAEAGPPLLSVAPGPRPSQPPAAHTLTQPAALPTGEGPPLLSAPPGPRPSKSPTAPPMSRVAPSRVSLDLASLATPRREQASADPIDGPTEALPRSLLSARSAPEPTEVLPIRRPIAERHDAPPVAARRSATNPPLAAVETPTEAIAIAPRRPEPRPPPDPPAEVPRDESAPPRLPATPVVSRVSRIAPILIGLNVLLILVLMLLGWSLVW